MSFEGYLFGKEYGNKNRSLKKQLSKESIYRILKSFDKIYSEFTDAEKKRFIGSFNAEREERKWKSGN